jgi:nicotinamidase/pyrazinamidase
MQALLLIDLQADFLSPDGRYPIPFGQAIALTAAANQACIRARGRGCRVVAIANEYPRWRFPINLFRNFAALSSSAGASWHPQAPSDWDVYFVKDRASAFSNRNFVVWLQEAAITHLHLLGVMANACVSKTATAALNRGYEVSLVEDAIGARTGNAKHNALRELFHRGCRRSDLL